jgi:hypothetical protein
MNDPSNASLPAPINVDEDKWGPAEKVRSPFQWSVWTLLMLTGVAAAWLGAWRLHFLAGFALTLILLPAAFLYLVTLVSRANAAGMKWRAFLCVIAFGALVPPILIASFSTYHQDEGTVNLVSRLLTGSLIGVTLATAYGVYVLLLMKFLELLFGPPK